VVLRRYLLIIIGPSARRFMLKSPKFLLGCRYHASQETQETKAEKRNQGGHCPPFPLLPPLSKIPVLLGNLAHQIWILNIQNFINCLSFTDAASI
jgi:hypothetical protein